MVELAPTGGGLYRRGFAGDTFNTAWYARRLLPADWRVAFGSCVGTDAISDEMLAFMAAEGIDTTATRRLPDRTVGLYMISVADGERGFSYWRDHAAARTPADDEGALDAMLMGRDFINFLGISVAILTPEGRQALCAALARARAGGARVVFDTNLRPRLWESAAAMRAGLTRAASVADIVLPSFDEETALFGDADPGATIARYRALGARLVAVKQGAGSVVLWQAETGEVALAPPPGRPRRRHHGSGRQLRRGADRGAGDGASGPGGGRGGHGARRPGDPGAWGAGPRPLRGRTAGLTAGPAGAGPRRFPKEKPWQNSSSGMCRRLRERLSRLA